MGPNHKLYRELSEPFESTEAANAAVKGFSDAVEEARSKFRMRDLYCVMQFDYVTESGEVTGGYTVAFGDEMRHEQMLAYSLGRVQAQRQEAIGKLLRQATLGAGKKGV